MLKYLTNDCKKLYLIKIKILVNFNVFFFVSLKKFLFLIKFVYIHTNKLLLELNRISGHGM